ncbi:hypothetical protein LAC1533_1422 [Ligilactobacillus acidipiscis]|uniref:Uncharacterized protein n=1 Tax=Ligilactobacillus acidipiscis TaxID=89059 RepID=A0A1K1KPP7_9LACO|nr:hypothetical protein LAC1533_1422 [Ligilactobacillus acidipiscis]
MRIYIWLKIIEIKANFKNFIITVRSTEITFKKYFAFS